MEVHVVNELACITNDMGSVPRRDRPFPCRRRGQHYASCENDQCRGCVPRSATHGHLCHVCYDKFLDALARVGWLIAHLRSVEGAGQPLERVSTSIEGTILMPDTWIAADDLLEALGSRPIRSTETIDEAVAVAHGAVDRWVSGLDDMLATEDGARSAVILMKRMRTALDRWKDSEAEYRHIPHLQCPTCHNPHLWRRAPQHVGDEIRVECSTPDCGYTRDWFEWSKQYAPIFEEIEKDLKRRERAARKVSS